MNRDPPGNQGNCDPIPTRCEEWERESQVNTRRQFAGTLDIGATYVVSRETPLMPFHSPADPVDAIKRMKRIPGGGSFKVVEAFDKDGTPWYKAIAWRADTEFIGTGWINSNAILGQELEARK